MTPELAARIDALRQALTDSDEEEMGMIALPCRQSQLSPLIPSSYAEFLKIADGASCGVVLLFESEGLLKKQSDALQLAGGRDRWFCIGMVMNPDADDRPIIMDRRSQAVHVMEYEGVFDPDSALGDLNYFLENYVFGPDYADFVVFQEDDAWYRLISRDL